MSTGGVRDVSISFATTLYIQVVNVATGLLAARLLLAEGRGELAALMLWPGLVAELGCASGRLNFADYLGCEVGFNGTETRGPIRSTTAALNRPRAFEVTRLEVIAAPAKAQR